MPFKFPALELEGPGFVYGKAADHADQQEAGYYAGNEQLINRCVGSHPVKDDQQAGWQPTPAV